MKTRCLTTVRNSKLSVIKALTSKSKLLLDMEAISSLLEHTWRRKGIKIDRSINHESRDTHTKKHHTILHLEMGYVELTTGSFDLTPGGISHISVIVINRSPTPSSTN